MLTPRIGVREPAISRATRRHGAIAAKYHQQIHLAGQGGRIGAHHGPEAGQASGCGVAVQLTSGGSN